MIDLFMDRPLAGCLTKWDHLSEMVRVPGEKICLVLNFPFFRWHNP